MKLIDILNKTIEAKKFLLNYKNNIVNYRLFDTINNKSYVGSTKNLYQRLYNKKFGHVGSLFLDTRHDYIHQKILEIGIENFEIFVESSNFLTIEDAELNEKLLIDKYDSFNNGYNLTVDGKGGNCGRIKITNGSDTLNIKPSQLNEYINNGYSVGSGRVVVTNKLTGKFKRILLPDLENYMNTGEWILGSTELSTTKGKISITNKLTGETKKVSKEDLINYDSNWYQGFGPNKGLHYIYNPNTGETLKVSNSSHYLKIGYKLGIIYRSGKYTMNNNGNVIKVSKSEVNKYLEQGYKYGK